MNENTKLPQPEKLYGHGTKKEMDTDLFSVYKTQTAKGTAIATQYKVMPGIELYYNDFSLSESLDYQDFTWDNENIMGIQHCETGRFQCEFPNGDITYIGEGDLAVTSLTNIPESSWYPMSRYKGISIIIEVDTAMETIRKLGDLLGIVPVDLACLQQKLNSQNQCFIMRSTAAISHIFDELYFAQDTMKQRYFSLKILELLLFLEYASQDLVKEKRLYFRKTQIQTIKAIEKYITEDLMRKTTLPQLSERFEVPLTAMKICFKEVYGTSIHQYIKTYRIQTAAHLLRETNKSIGDIAFEIGYDSPSKFTSAFRGVMEVTPTDYRIKFLSEWNDNKLIGLPTTE